MKKLILSISICLVCVGCSRSPYPGYDSFKPWIEKHYETLNEIQPYLNKEEGELKIWLLGPLRYSSLKAGEYARVEPKYVSEYERLLPKGDNIILVNRDGLLSVSPGVTFEGHGRQYIIAAVQGKNISTPVCEVERLKELKSQCHIEFYKEWKLEYFPINSVEE